MWPFNRNKVKYRKEKRPRLGDLMIQARLIRTHIAGIHSQFSTMVTYYNQHGAMLTDVAERLRAIEERDRPVRLAHLAPDEHGRPHNHVEHGLPVKGAGDEHA